jgi:hypothetical protein
MSSSPLSWVPLARLLSSTTPQSSEYQTWWHGHASHSPQTYLRCVIIQIYCFASLIQSCKLELVRNFQSSCKLVNIELRNIQTAEYWLQVWCVCEKWHSTMYGIHRHVAQNWTKSMEEMCSVYTVQAWFTWSIYLFLKFAMQQEWRENN